MGLRPISDTAAGPSSQPSRHRTRVARRVRWLFFLCALLPVGALAVVSYSLVAKQLNDQSRDALLQASKNTGMTTYARLGLLEESLRAVALTRHLVGASKDRFRALVIQRKDGTQSPLKGETLRLPNLTPPQQEHLALGGTVLLSPSVGSEQTTLLMAVLLDPGDARGGIVWAEPDPSHLWYGSSGEIDTRVTTLPPGMELCVFGTSPSPLHCSDAIDWTPLSLRLDDQFRAPVSSATELQFEWSDKNQDYVSAYWSLPLRFQYAMPAWTFIISESRTSVLAPLSHLRAVFPATVLLALLVVLLLSNVQIRRSLEPLAVLMAGTERVANQDFDGLVIVESGDEFEDLAESFNDMAMRVGSSFKALSAINQIGHAVQRTLKSDGIIETVLPRALELFGCDSAGVVVIRETSARTTHLVGGARPAFSNFEHLLSGDELEELRANRHHLRLAGARWERSYLDCDALSELQIDSLLVFPLFAAHELSGLMVLGYVDPTTSTDEDTEVARQVADQVAVALSNARLVEDLNELNIGTLTALARAIDAKSPWTAGHSERVTELALRIGNQLSLTDEALSQLHRGGLLHDVGKIGIPGAILDKQSKLTDEETQTIRQHPQIGARILAPIAAYADAIPIVRHHHEQFDGSGYPDGLAGEGIPILARILAVADVYDSCRLDRPYRAGMSQEDTLDIIRRGAGSHFDPAIVAALLAIMAEPLESIDAQATSDAKPTAARRHA